MTDKHYKGNPNLKAENVQIEFTTDQVNSIWTFSALRFGLPL